MRLAGLVLMVLGYWIAHNILSLVAYGAGLVVFIIGMYLSQRKSRGFFP